MTYRDMTFCNYYKDCKLGEGCHRALTLDVQKAAGVWWGEDGAPITMFAEKPSCHKQKPIPKDVARINRLLRQVWSQTYKKEYEKEVRFKKLEKKNSKEETWHHKCTDCGIEARVGAKTEIQYKNGNKGERRLFEVDHLEGLPTFRDLYNDLVPFVIALFSPLTGYRILCYHCHQKRTKEQQEVRRNEAK